MPFYEEDAHLNLQTSTGEVRLDRNNAALFTHIGELGMYNHVFVQTDPDNDDAFGSYIFRHNPSFKFIASWMVENELPMHLNSTDVADCDRDAFDQCIAKEAQEPIPEGWMD